MLMITMKGRLPDSILYYRQAVQVNDNLPEALCGMVHAVWSVCDWRGMGRINNIMSIDFQGKTHSPLDEMSVDGWMPKLVETTRKQISEAYKLNRGIIRTTGTLEDWLGWIESSINIDLTLAQKTHWNSILQRYFSDLDHERDTVNEGGFMIRIVEWLTKVLQWRWYSEVYGDGNQLPLETVRPLYDNVSAEHKDKYRRPRVSSAMSLLALPSVLPFHTVSILSSCANRTGVHTGNPSSYIRSMQENFG